MEQQINGSRARRCRHCSTRAWSGSRTGSAPRAHGDVLEPTRHQVAAEGGPAVSMRSMTELREAVEPRAAFLTAQRASSDMPGPGRLAAQLRIFHDPAVRQARRQRRGMPRGVPRCRLHRRDPRRIGQRAFPLPRQFPVEAALDFRITSEWERTMRRRLRAFASSSPGEQPAGRMKKFPYAPSRCGSTTGSSTPTRAGLSSPGRSSRSPRAARRSPAPGRPAEPLRE